MPAAMRVAMLSDCAYQDRASGVERSTFSLVEGLRSRGVDVTIMAPERIGAKRPTDDDTMVIDMRGRYQVLYGYRRWIAAAHETLRDLDPDVVHGQGLLHNGLAAATWRQCPSVVTAHGNPVQDALWHYPRLIALPLTVPLRSTAARVVRSADAVVNVTPDWQANCPGPPRRQEFIPNPIQDLFFDTETPAGTPRVLFFGGLRTIKGLGILLDAWEEVADRRPDASLHVWGMPREYDHPLVARCRRTRACVLEGLTGAEGVAAALQAGGVVVVPSHFEVAPLAIAEAWATGVPVVATAVGGVPAYAGDSVLLCPEADPRALAEATIKALDRDASVEAMVRRGRARAEEQRVGVVTDAHLALYNDLLEGARP